MSERLDENPDLLDWIAPDVKNRHVEEPAATQSLRDPADQRTHLPELDPRRSGQL